MFIWKTVFKVGFLAVILLVILFIFKLKLSQPSNQNLVTKKPGWTITNEQFILNNCPSVISPQTCSCMLKQAETKYSYKQVADMYQNYQKNKNIDPSIYLLLASCR